MLGILLFQTPDKRKDECVLWQKNIYFNRRAGPSEIVGMQHLKATDWKHEIDRGRTQICISSKSAAKLLILFVSEKKRRHLVAKGAKDCELKLLG